MTGLNTAPCDYCGDGDMGNHPECVIHYVTYGEDEMNVTHTGGPLWKVQSESSNKWYDVDLDRPHCNCPNFALQRNKLKSQGQHDAAEKYLCKHLKAVQNQTGSVVGQPSMDDEERSRVAARKAAIIGQFVEREPSIQEKALRSMAELKSVKGGKRK